MSKLTVACKAFAPIWKNTLVGKADLHIAELKLTIRGVLIFESHGKRWASLPSPPMTDRNGVALRGNGGKIKYLHVFVFDNRGVSDAFSERAVAAVLAHNPRLRGRGGHVVIGVFEITLFTKDGGPLSKRISLRRSPLIRRSGSVAFVLVYRNASRSSPRASSTVRRRT